MTAQVQPFPLSARVRLSERQPFRLGAVEVRPAERAVIGPAGPETIEPRVMQVLVALADDNGAVVSRDTLVERCWEGRIVGDDAIVRVISQLRRLAKATGGAFAIETIARVGYRLRAASPVEALPPGPPDFKSGAIESPASMPARTRRAVLAAGGAAGAAVLAAALWPPAAGPDPARIEADRLFAEGAKALRDGLPARDAQGIGFLREAVRLDPGDPDIWGKLALAYVHQSEYAEGEAARAALARAEAAARQALALDPGQGDALAARATAKPVFGRWAAAEADLRRVLATTPANLPALAALSIVLQSVGRSAEIVPISDRIVAAEPLSPVYAFRHIYALWNVGRLEEADRAAARARALWPRHPSVWNVAWLLFAFTGRAEVARDMTLDREARPEGLPPIQADRLALAAEAMATRDPGTTAGARSSVLAMAREGPFGAVQAIMLLTGLGALDDAFAVAEGYLLRRGPMVMPLAFTDTQFSLNDQRQKKTMMLFIPATAPMRADSRFLPLCEDLGLGAYWRMAGLRPDFLARQR
jgi:DNA-binding winged helix-turn-helix (wHTH) protein/Flp pilus assembly protein TadD